MRKFTVLIQGGLGPDVWDCEIELEEENIQEALRVACGKAAEIGGHVVSIEEHV